MWARRAREGSGMERGPTGGSVVEDAQVERSTGKKTSHQVILSAGSCVGCCTIEAAAWSRVSTSRGAISEGSTNIRPWLGSETASRSVSVPSAQPDAVEALSSGSGLPLQLHIDSTDCISHSVPVALQSGSGGISPLIGVYDAYGRGGTILKHMLHRKSTL